MKNTYNFNTTFYFVRPLLAAFTLVCASPGFAQWFDFARDSQHTAQSGNASQSLNTIHWQTLVDLNPQYRQGELLIHYGSPLVTAANTVIVPVKTGPLGGFRVDARNGTTGSLIWSLTSDYLLPPHQWTPVFGPAMSSTPRVYFPGAAGSVYYRDSPDSANGSSGRLFFYGNHNSTSMELIVAFQSNVKINTPITADAAGNIYFGFLVGRSGQMLPLYDDAGQRLESGIARISASGAGSWTPVTVAANDASMRQVVMNCAPALSNDGSTLYVAVSDGSAGYYAGPGQHHAGS